mgnify:FL=1
MKTNPDQLWKRLLQDAAPPAVSEATEEEVSRIVAHLRWQPAGITLPSWEEALWPLLLRFALPGAALILICASLLPTPEAPVKGDSVDDLIAALLPPP